MYAKTPLSLKTSAKTYLSLPLFLRLNNFLICTRHGGNQHVDQQNGHDQFINHEQKLKKQKPARKALNDAATTFFVRHRVPLTSNIANS